MKKHFRFLALAVAGILSCTAPLGVLGSELTEADEIVQEEITVQGEETEAFPVPGESADEAADPGKTAADPAAEAAVTEGACGDGLTWEFTDGSLYIRGTGDMYDYDGINVPEWDAYKEEISALYIEEGISLLDGDAFEGFSLMEDLYFGGSQAEWEALEVSGSKEKAEVFEGVKEFHFEKEDPAPAGGRPAKAPAAAAGDLALTEEPSDQSAAAGKTVTLHVEANRADVCYQWQWSKNGTAWTDCTSAGGTTDTFSFTMREQFSGRLYRCLVYDDSDEVVSRSARITTASEEALEITVQPADVEAAAGENVSLHVEANRADASYQWQYSKNGTSWTNCTSGGCRTDTFGFTMKASLSGRYYRCVVTSGSEEVTSYGAHIVLAEGLKITEQPSDVSARAGEKVRLHVAANRADASYQWQYSKNGTSWTNCTSGGCRTDTFEFVMKASLAGRTYRCIVSLGNETQVSEGAVISLGEALELVTEPEDVVAAAGESVSLHVRANMPDAVYQWQWSKDGTNWTNCTSGGARTDTFAFVMKAAINGRIYRCVVSCGSETVTSRGAVMTMSDPVIITEQPEDTEAAAGERVTIHVGVSGSGVTYQWQYSKNSGATWTNCTSGGYKTDTFSFTMKESMNNRLYRCALTYGSQTIYTDSALITLAVPDEIVIDGVVYELVGDEMTVTGYRGSAENVVVQETVDGHTVTVIGESAFEGKTTIRQIDLPDTIQIIKKRAFADCTGLTNIN